MQSFDFPDGFDTVLIGQGSGAGYSRFGADQKYERFSAPERFTSRQYIRTDYNRIIREADDGLKHLIGRVAVFYGTVAFIGPAAPTQGDLNRLLAYLENRATEIAAEPAPDQ